MSSIDLLMQKYGLSLDDIALILGTTPKNTSEGKENIQHICSEFLDSPLKFSKLIEHSVNSLSSRKCKTILEQINSELHSKFSSVIKGSVFLKQLKSNELGFRSGVPNKAGSFILVPKNCTWFFPTILGSNTILNANVKVNICVHPENEKRTLEYVYHNSKIVDGIDSGRDEYRLYISNIINNKILFSPDDIVLVYPLASTNEYIILRFSTRSPFYQKLLSLIKKYKDGRANAAMVNIADLFLNNVNIPQIFINNFNSSASGNISNNVEESLVNTENIAENEEDYIVDSELNIDTLNLENAIEALLNSDLQNENIEIIIQKIKKIKRDYRFRKVILHAYNRQCAITNASILYGNRCNVQACHIKAKHAKGVDHPSNGIALSMDLHWAFDLGMFTINDDYTIIVHPKMKHNTQLSKIAGVKITLPINQDFYPNLDSLKYHRDNIYGSF